MNLHTAEKKFFLGMLRYFVIFVYSTVFLDARSRFKSLKERGERKKKEKKKGKASECGGIGTTTTDASLHSLHLDLDLLRANSRLTPLLRPPSGLPVAQGQASLAPSELDTTGITMTVSAAAFTGGAPGAGAGASAANPGGGVSSGPAAPASAGSSGSGAGAGGQPPQQNGSASSSSAASAAPVPPPGLGAPGAPPMVAKAREEILTSLHLIKDIRRLETYQRDFFLKVGSFSVVCR